ncbi:unnamed protein product [Gongylonema pulchrum]|uniref:39S ribosomal protein L51, mitochondrial n=1 Tax=Gongylonema pulchrum TaxID=637853 RepID=A0A183CUT5_9BILA|nr:unnamed protein product [Gongylonema pulchrum]
MTDFGRNWIEKKEDGTESCNTEMISATTFAIAGVCLICKITATAPRLKRQTYVYDESLRQHARPHPRTRIITGTVGRYAPQEWPGWYTRTLFKWNGEVRMGPYHPNDVRYDGYQRARFQTMNSNIRRL